MVMAPHGLALVVVWINRDSTAGEDYMNYLMLRVEGAAQNVIIPPEGADLSVSSSKNTVIVP